MIRKDLLRGRTFLWSLLTFVMIVAALLVPTEVIRSVSGVFGASAPAKIDAFSDETVQLDQALQNGAPLPAEWRGETADETAAKLASMRVYLQLRRLTRAGPMPLSDMDRAQKIFEEFNPQIARQELEGSRAALKKERDRRLVAAIPRLNKTAVSRELDTLEAQLQAVKKP